MGDRRGLAWGDVFRVGVEPEREGGYFKAIPRLGESPDTTEKLAILMMDAVDAMNLGRLS